MGLENFLNDRMTEEDTYNYTLPEILHTRAEHTPDQTAYIYLKDGEDDEEKVTYRELDHVATTIAQRLIALNLRGERALMLYPPGPGISFKALFGCFYAGVIAVPAYPPRKNRSLERIRLMVVDSGAKVVLTTDDIYKTFERSFSDVEELKGLTWLPTNVSDNTLIPSSPLPVPASPLPIALRTSPSSSTPPVPPGSPKASWSPTGISCGMWIISVRALNFPGKAFQLPGFPVFMTWA